MKILCITILFLCNLLAFGQHYSVISLEKIPLRAERFIGFDNLNDLYYVHSNSLYKHTRNDVLFFRDFGLGKIGAVDILNPLKIVVFYPQFETAVILDNKLNEIRRINFPMNPPFLNVSNVSAADGNRLWIFNTDSQQLELYNYRTAERIVLSRPLSGVYITQKSNFNYCFLLTKQNLRLFNIYGSLLHSIPNEGFSETTESNNVVVGKKGNSLILFTENLTVKQALAIPEIRVKDLYLREDFLYIYDGEFIHKTQLSLNKK